MSRPSKARRASLADNKVVIGFLHPGMVTTEFTRSLAVLCLENPRQAIIGLHVTRTARSFSGRNQTIQKFLDGPGDWLLWIDSDMVFTPEDFEKLYQEAIANPEAQIVTGLCFMWDENREIIMPNFFLWDEDTQDYRATAHYEPNQRQWADATGVAFTMIHREVFEKMGFPWHEEHIVHPDTGKTMAHDIGFYHQARLAGYRVRYCADARIGHVKSWIVQESSFNQQLQLYARQAAILAAQEANIVEAEVESE